MAAFGHYNYWIAILLMMVGLYIVVARGNLVKKLVGLNIFQASVFLFYISMGKVLGGTAPIAAEGIELYSNPLPHVLILTAIVVGGALVEAEDAREQRQRVELERGNAERAGAVAHAAVRVNDSVAGSPQCNLVHLGICSTIEAW